MLSLLIFISCKNNNDLNTNTSQNEDNEEFDWNENVIVSMEILNYGIIEIELYHEYAPITVEHFCYLVNNGLYDGTDFIRMQSDFVLQGGANCINQETIKGEFNSNGWENNLSHTKGVISMARATNNDSATSQFFIMLSDNYSSVLDGNYAAFGKVINGWDVIEKILNDIDSSFFTNDYYGLAMGFFKEDHYIKIREAKIIKK